jgi:thiol:disulfide interchange protein DsbD
MDAQPSKQNYSAASKHLLIVAAWIFLCIPFVAAQGQGITSGNNSLLSSPRFLPAEQAFNFYTSLPEPNVIKLHWTIAPGYYLYKEKFALSTIINGETLTFPLQLPNAIAHNDEFFGDVQVYFNNVVAQADLHELADQGAITLMLEYQGCAQAGFCYTLQRLEIPLVI